MKILYSFAFSFLLMQTAVAELNNHELRNQEVVLQFYEKAINEKDYQAASQYLGNGYIQHNPTVEDGPSGFDKFIDFLKRNYPNAHGTIKRFFVQDDYVILHVLSKLTIDDAGRAIVDIFRLEDGKIVEHWDVIQAIVSSPKTIIPCFRNIKSQ